MAIKSMEMAVESMESMEMAPGALPRPDRVLEQRLLSPQIGLRRAALQNFSGKNTDSFRVFTMEALYRRRGNVRGQPGASHHRVARPGVHPHHHLVWSPPGPPSTLLWTPSRAGGKIGTSGFVSSNSKNISCVTFLKHKNSRKQGTGTMASRQ
jgi:hypothetical protein